MHTVFKRAYRAVVVGSGPAGFYSAQELLAVGATRVDIVERMPQPFGLVRTGIAPDHFNDKRVANDFTDLLRDSRRIRFFGNVNVADTDVTDRDVLNLSSGRVSLTQLRRDYPVVVLAYGSQRDRLLGVDRESQLSGVHSARTFAAWYNSSPRAQHLPFAEQLQQTDTAVIVGNGNVSLDVARILCKDCEELATTDISPVALGALRKSAVRNVHIIGRRGLIHASFTNRELREILQLPGCNVSIKLDEPLSQADVDVMNSTRQGKRQLPLWRAAIDTPQRDAANQYNITFHFQRSVSSLSADADGKLSGVQLARNAVDSSGAFKRVSDNHETLTGVGLLFRSIGFDGEQCSPDVPLGPNGAVLNNEGRVTGLPGVYVCGWLKRGPSGIVGTNKFDAVETAAAVKADLDAAGSPPKGNETCLDALLADRSVRVVTSNGWLAIQAAEESKGNKIDNALDMIQFATA